MAISSKKVGTAGNEEGLTPDEQREFYTPGEVARMFGVTSRTVANWCDKGRLAYVETLGGQRRILASSIKGGRDYDAKKAALVARLAELHAGKPVPTDDEIVEEIRSRRL
jgi:excisionase family DNA binding protein